MKIFYATRLDLLRRRRTTNRVADVRLCQSLATAGADVTLVVPYALRRDNISRADVRRLFEIHEPLAIEILPTPLWEAPPRHIEIPIWTSAVVARYLLAASQPGFASTFWLSRDHNTVNAFVRTNTLLRQKRPTVVYWAHEYVADHRRISRAYRSADGVLATNSAIINDLSASGIAPRSHTALTYNPVSPTLFASLPNRVAARATLKIPPGTRLVAYTGKVGADLPEIDLIIRAAALLPSYVFVMTGGPAEALEHFRSECRRLRIANVRFVGFLPEARDVRLYQQAADALVSYYPESRGFADYNYPHKISEYMASGTPIVTPDYRATRDILSRNNAHFVLPESPSALANGIRAVVEDASYGRTLADQAFIDGQEATYAVRGRVVAEFLERLRSARGLA